MFKRYDRKVPAAAAAYDPFVCYNVLIGDVYQSRTNQGQRKAKMPV
jgi:hypothetical protein